MLRSPLAWVGGKSRLRPLIIERFPAHSVYVEVFGGAAWVLFGKDPAASKVEVLNDLDGELINFWRVIKQRPAAFSEAAGWLLASRELWQSWRGFEAVAGEVERAARFYLVIKCGFGAMRNSTSFAGSDARNLRRPRLLWPDIEIEAQAIVERLRKVWIENLTWDRCLDLFDRRETFFYCDPPYRCGGSKAYAHSFIDDDHQRLAARLRGKIKGKWLLSYNDDPFIERLYRGRGITIERLRVPYSIARQGRQHVEELLIRNY